LRKIEPLVTPPLPLVNLGGEKKGGITVRKSLCSPYGQGAKNMDRAAHWPFMAMSR